MIPLSVPNITGNEIKYVTKALEEQWVSTAGESIRKLEENMAEYAGVSYACACQSGTAGLHLCLRHFGIGEGDIILVPTLTFIASINAIMYERAVPVFTDCDEQLCMDVSQVADYLLKECEKTPKGTIEKESGRRVKAVMPVHIFGDMCNMEVLMDLAEEYGLVVIEDATEALGSRYNRGRYQGKMAGSIGHAGVFSFNGNKIITTGGGGMIITNDRDACEHMRYLSQQAKDDAFAFVHNEVGYNYRMTNIQAALGLGQMERLEEFISHKRKHLELYQELLKDSRIGNMLSFREEIDSNAWFYSFCLNKECRKYRDELMDYLKEKQIQVRPVWKLNHTQKPFADFKALTTKNAEDFQAGIINLPCSSNLTEEEVRTVCEEILNFEKIKGRL